MATDFVKMEVEGLRKLSARFKALPEKLVKRWLKDCLEQASQPILEASKANVHNVSGQLQQSLQVVFRFSKKKGQYKAVVQTGDKWYHGDQYAGAFVEFGHKLGSRKLGDKRKDVPPHPFIGKAYRDEKENSKQILERLILEALESAAVED